MREDEFESPDRVTSAPVQSMGGCLLHMFAHFVGAFVLAILALLVALREPWQWSVLDVVYFGTTTVWMLARRAQARRESGVEPGSGIDPRHTIWLFGAAVGVWILANAVRIA